MATNLEDLFWSIVGAGGGGGLIAYLLFKKLGESWLDAKFSEKLEAFRHDKAKELERLRADIDGSLRAKVRHQEKEFLVLSECWSLMNVAYGSAHSFVSVFQQYEDISQMTADLRREYVDKMDILPAQKNEILTDANPTNEYIRIAGMIQNNAANKAIVEFNNCVYRDEIFLDEEISDEFKSIIRSLQSAVLNKQLARENQIHALGTEAWKELQDQCHPKIAEVARKLRERIGRYGN